MIFSTFIKEALEWLEYMNQEHRAHPFKLSIQHAFNGKGEKRIGKYFLDGYIEWDTPDGHVACGYEYRGCRFHRCPHNCDTVSIQTDEEYKKEQERMDYLRRILTNVYVIYGCEWKKLKRRLKDDKQKIESDICSFLTRESVSETEILDAVRRGEFYGLVRADICTPDHVIEKYGKLNFPLIFNNLEITEDLLSPETLRHAEERKIKFPVTAKTLTWNAEGYIGCTPLLQFYMELGMEIKNIQWALQYQKATPFGNFVKAMVDVRVAAKKNKNGPAGDRAKFVLNSSVGKLFKYPRFFKNELSEYTFDILILNKLF